MPSIINQLIRVGQLEDEVARLQAELAAAHKEAEGWQMMLNVSYPYGNQCIHQEITRDSAGNIVAIEEQCLVCEQWNGHADDCPVQRYEDEIEMADMDNQNRQETEWDNYPTP